MKHPLNHFMWIKMSSNMILVSNLYACRKVWMQFQMWFITLRPMMWPLSELVLPWVKMVLSGEGSDELFGGYLHFHKAPNKEEFHTETCRKVFQMKVRWSACVRMTILLYIACALNINMVLPVCFAKLCMKTLNRFIIPDKRSSSLWLPESEQINVGLGCRSSSSFLG